MNVKMDLTSLFARGLNSPLHPDTSEMSIKFNMFYHVTMNVSSPICLRGDSMVTYTLAPQIKT